MADVIMGAGVIGLHAAYYLKKIGRDVIVIDKTAADNNCSFGNAGYISPSHFIPLATPGIVWQGLRWMFDNTSPFYIKPRADGSLIKWGWLFWKNANHRTVQKNAPHLFRLLKLSRSLSIDLQKELGYSFNLKQDGCLMLYTNKNTGHEEALLARQAKHDYGLDVPLLNTKELQQLDPLISDKVLGGAYYKIDCHLNPMEMMSALKTHLVEKGVRFVLHENIKSFDIQGNTLQNVITDHGSYPVDNCIIAAGSWSPLLSKKLGINLPLQAGKGYSHTYLHPQNNIQYPAILVDHRVAMTPLGNDLRVGGTMEIGGLDLKVSHQRIPPIIKAANLYYNELHLPVPTIDQVWAGLRPVSPDGLPYIGKDQKYKNVYVAAGHAMIGISSAAATGFLLSQMITGQATEIQVDAFRVNRF
jgi:D-amino-acid dehydrogenase